MVPCGLITLFFIWQLPKLSFTTSVYDLIIEEMDESIRYDQFLARFGSDEIIRIVVKADDILDPATFAKITQLSDAAAQIDGVIRVISLPEVKKSVDPKNQWTMTQFASMLIPVELFHRNLIAEDGRTTIITLVLDASTNKDDAIFAVEALFRTTGKDLRLYQTGMPLVSEALAAYTRQDFFHLTPITMGVIALLLTVLFRNPQCLVLPLSCVTLAICWTFGLMATCGISVSMLTIIVPVFLIAVGTAYCLHIASEYLQHAASGESARTAVLTTFDRLAFPVTLAVATTIFGLGSLIINRIVAIQEFAIFAGFGMVSMLIIVLTFFPAMLACLPAPNRMNTGQSFIDRSCNRLIKTIVNINLRYRKATLMVMGAVSIICALGMLRVRVETNPVAFFKSDTEVRKNFTDCHRHMSGSFPINVVMSASESDYFENPENVAAIERFQTYLDRLPGVDKTISLADYLKLVNYTVNGFDSRFYTLPQEGYELRMLMNNFKVLLGNDLLKRFLSAGYDKANILMLTHIASSRLFHDTQQRIHTHAKNAFPDDISVDVTGLGIVIAASSHLLTLGQIKSLAISLVLIFSVMVLLFLSGKVGLIAVVPNLFPIVVNFGLMGFLDIPLSVATSLIASVAIGLAVDDTIHYLVRYNTEFKKDLNKDRAMRETLMSVGRPIVFTSLTISLGFSVLIFSHFQPTAIFGFLMVVTMVSALLADLMLLPTLMMRVELVTAWDLLKMMPSSGGISPATVHELNQPLNAIKVGSDFLTMMARQEKPPSPSHLSNVAREIGNQVARASRIIQRLSEIGQTRGLEKAPLQVIKPIKDTLAVFENQLKLESIGLDLFIQPELPPIRGHRNRLVQVLCNLLENAREAIAVRKNADETENNGHRITIAAREQSGSVVITVRDTGAGIAAHHLHRIFEPFFTTKSDGQGKGLGLSICHEIVRDMGGRITVESDPGNETTVTLIFPAIASTLHSGGQIK